MAVAPEARESRLLTQGSETAERLFEEHSGWVYGYCLRVLRSPEEAEDALQTTYMNACRSLNQGTRPEVGSAWLLRIAQNVCFTRLRSSGRRSKVERVQDIGVLEETVAAPDRRQDDLLGLTDALVSLPTQQRNAILLREWKGLSYSEIAAELEITQSAVETLIFRARRSLAAGLEQPPKRTRLRSVHAFDLAGILTAIKGFFAGSAGVKAVAALTVVAATTTTVVAADPVGILRDRDRPGRGNAPTAVMPAPSPGTAAGPALVTPLQLIGAPADPGKAQPADGDAGPGQGKAKAKGKPGSTPVPGPDGNGHGQGNGSPNGNANGQGNGNPNPGQGAAHANGTQGKAQAPGRLKDSQAPAQGKGAAAADQPQPPGQAKPLPPQAQGPEKAKKAKATD